MNALVAAADERPSDGREIHDEVARMPPAPLPRQVSVPALVIEGNHVSVQVNVDGNGLNIVDDAANESTIAADPTDPRRLAIGWRQFDSVASSFREAGVAHTTDGGVSWTTSTIDEGVFRTDPVLTFDHQGRFHYYSMWTQPGGGLHADVFTSVDGGATWPVVPVYAFGGDKGWITTDRDTAGKSQGQGNLYANWTFGVGCCQRDHFNRSVDAGGSFESPIEIPEHAFYGTVAVGPDGEVYIAGKGSPYIEETPFVVVKSTTLQDAGQPPLFDFATRVALGGSSASDTQLNGVGLLSQLWIEVDRSNGPRRGWVYLLSSVEQVVGDPADVYFVRSVDGGLTWSQPLRINVDTQGWQWFAMLSIGPGSELDVVWNDTPASAGGAYLTRLKGSHSDDGGFTWTPEETLSPAFNPKLGYPQQDKLGDYYHMVTDATGTHVAYAATFNGEQDVYYLHLPHGWATATFRDGFESGNTSRWSNSTP